MIKDKKHSVVEFNCRFGDPETQPLLFRIDSDIFDLFYLTALGELDKYKLKWKNKTSVSVVLASKGYPMKPKTGMSIKNLDKITLNDDQYIFHAGTSIKDQEIIINGGRVLNITASGDNLKEAINSAYKIINMLDSSNLQYRKDIGAKGLLKNS